METGFAQYSFTRWDSIPVIIAGDTIKNPWAGGFNNPQFSDIDLNGDGIKDLFVFDRSGNRIITFLNNGTPDEVDYKHAPEYQSKFPDLRSWVLLVDYNNDGKEDIFTSAYYGVKVYRNDYNAVDGLKFVLANSLLEANSVLLYISEWDIPAITDVDNDGDIDILTFNFAGSKMEYYENLSIENYGNSDSLEYTLGNDCWGNFRESWGDCSIILDTCGPAKMTEESLHAGSTTLALDLDCDNDMEIIIGDITCTNAHMLTNGGDSDSASMTSVDTLYPLAYPLDIYYFQAAFYEDVNNDGVRDLLAAPNALYISENFTSAWYYKNIGTDSCPNFLFQTDAFLQGGMIEVGEGANPVFFDYNGDSLLDLVIGNHGYFSISPPYTSGLSLYKNVGTLSSPVFELITRDYANIYSYGFLGVYPAFGDLDNDGDEDMILGESEGHLLYFNNIADSGNPADFVLTQPPYYQDIDVGQYSAPQLADVNCDGLLDLLIGEKDGTLNYYENTGTLTSPDFSDTATIKNFGGVNVKLLQAIAGYSTPFFTKFNSSGEHSLLVGSESGYIYYYTNIDDNLEGQFTLTDSAFSGISEGVHASISGGDLNRDGTIDLVAGNYRGGIALFLNSGSPVPNDTCFPFDTIVHPVPGGLSIWIFPNPVSENLYVNILGTFKGDVAEIEIYNTIGQEILSKEYENNLESISISVGNYAYGIYFCKVNIISERNLLFNSVMLKFAVIK